MLRRRILASAMASVMAIGSVAVVANAETTAAATTQAKTKADLEAYVNSLDSFVSGKLSDYGSISGEKFLDAYEYAQNIVADSKATLDDYTVAYAMLEATYNKLKIYTAEELKALLDANKKNYEDGNVYNEELGDPVFEETGYATFEDAYEDAEAYLNSSDSRNITDAYEALEDAVANLSRYTVVTKAQFRTALKNYEAMLQKEYAYESWRVGTMNSWVDLNTSVYWTYMNKSISYGVLFEHLESIKKFVNDAYEQMDEIKSLNKTSLPAIVNGYNAAVDAVTVMDNWVADDTARGSKSGVKKLLDSYHNRLVYDYATTDAEDLFAAVQTVSEGNMKVLITINDGQATKWLDLSKDDDADEFTAYGTPWNSTSIEYTADPDLDGYGVTVSKVSSAGINVKSGVAFYIPLDNDGYWTGDALTTSKPEGKYKMITKNVEVDLTDYINVTAADITSDYDNADFNNVLDGDMYDWATWPNWAAEYISGWNTITGLDVGTISATDPEIVLQYNEDEVINSDGVQVPVRSNLKDAYALAELYLDGDKEAIADSSNLIYTLDTTNSIGEGKAKGSSTEWTMVYRFLAYALHDKYDTSYDLYTKADVNKLIEDAYQLAEDTGDAALFSIRHNDLVDARQFALDWVKAANKDKTYKDNVSAPAVDGTYYTSTDVYTILNNYYTLLQKEYAAFEISFGDVYNKIADVKTMIDDGDLEATSTLVAALEEAAYRLSVVGSFEEEYNIDNDAFTTDRYFQSFNRVYTLNDSFSLATDKSTSTDADTGVVTTSYTLTSISSPSSDAVSYSHYLLKNAYDALVAEVKAQTETAVKVGDVNGDGIVNALDAAEILKRIAANTAIDVAVGDYNADGVANALDASKILQDVAAGIL